jgi:chromate transporter
VREVAAVMLELGTVAFGGPAVHVAMLHEQVVRRRGWLDDREFLDLFAAVSLLPGPSSTQLAIALSRRRAGWLGLAIGGACFVAPAMGIVLVLAWAYVRYGTTPAGLGVLYGLEPAVVAVVVVALWELARTAAARPWFLAIGGMAMAAYFGGVNVLVPLLAGGLIVTVIEHPHRPPGGMRAWVLVLPTVPTTQASRMRPGVVEVLAEFAKLGLTVFGSGYVLLAFLRADVVDHLGWLTDHQVLDAVAAGQVTPGPVFTTATFVGYLLGGVPLAVAATAGIFLPSFLLVAAIEPLIGRIRRSVWLGPALSGVTIAAVGLMAGVTADLTRTAITDPLTALIGLAALAALLRWRPNALWVLAVGAVVGAVHGLL